MFEYTTGLDPVATMQLRVRKGDLEGFKNFILNEGNKSVFHVESFFLLAQVDRVKKRIRIIERKYGKSHLTPNEIDNEVAYFLKLATRAGFTFMLENKYSN